MLSGWANHAQWMGKPCSVDGQAMLCGWANHAQWMGKPCSVDGQAMLSGWASHAQWMGGTCTSYTVEFALAHLMTMGFGEIICSRIRNEYCFNLCLYTCRI